jgi:arylsulfatase A-like enzyme
MIVRIPGLTEGKQTLPDAVGLVDVMPTVLDALGQDKPAHLTGESFLGELQNQGSSAPRAAVSGFMGSWRTVGVGSLKLMQRGPENMKLFDVKLDPHEATDVAAQRPIALRYARGLLGITLAQAASGTRSSASPSRSREPVAAAKAKAPAAASDDVKKARVHKEETTEIDPETEAQLRALGYVGTSRPKAEPKKKE